jgi:DNA-binding PadR family transcriptional regulator
MKKQEMVMVLKDPKQEELLENPSYSRIIGILRKGELNVKEIHKLFNENYEEKKTLTSIYRYMEKLLENDLIFVSREEIKKKHIIERYYSRTAMFFLFEKERFKKNVVNATLELFQQIYNADKESGKELEKLFHEHGKNMSKREVDFFKKRGEEILKLEKKYGFKAAKNATYTFIELLYFRENPELLERIFKILEG